MEMAVKSGRSDEPFEMRLNDTAAMEDVDGSALEAYAQAVGAKPGRKLLAKRGFLVRGRLANAGVSFSRRNPNGIWFGRRPWWKYERRITQETRHWYVPLSSLAGCTTSALE